MLIRITALVLVILSAIGIFFAEPLSTLWAGSEDIELQPTRVAHITQVKGNAVLMRDGLEKLKVKQKIFSNDRIRTSESSKVELKMRSGHRVVIVSDSEVAFHIWMDKYVAYVYQGQVRLLNSSGAVDQLIIADDNSARFIEEDLVPTPKSSATFSSPQEGLTNEQIQTAIRSLHPQFQRCYLRLRKEGIAKPGKAVINFHIEPKGKIVRAQVSSSSFDNDDFHQCLMTVIQRAKVPAFNGKPIVANYPMNFR